MIGALHGTVQAITDTDIILLVGGVGYRVAVPHPHLLTAGTELFLHTHLAVRETALDLYGFTTETDKTMFALLLGVPKIGPKSALAVLQQASATTLIECIQQEDSVKLHKTTGIGKKTAENITNHLTEKIAAAFPEQLPAADDTDDLTPIHLDAIDALVTLGFDPKTAREVVLTGGREHTTVSAIVSFALQQR